MRSMLAFFRLSLCCCFGWALAWLPAHAQTIDWPVTPSRLQLQTPHGILHVANTEYVYDARLYVDDELVRPEIRGRLDITYAYETPNGYYALVSVDTGENACALYFHWISLGKGGYTVSPRFGACSATIRVEADAQVLTVHTPSPTDDSLVYSFRYDGQALQCSRRSAWDLPPLPRG